MDMCYKISKGHKNIPSHCQDLKLDLYYNIDNIDWLSLWIIDLFI